MTRWAPEAMGWRGAWVAVLVLLAALGSASTAVAHEQKTMTVILLSNGVASGNISDPSFVQGNALWFKMEDNTNNTTMVVRLDVDRDGEFNASTDFESPTLTDSCTLDDNGSLVDETCAVSTTYVFNGSDPVGEYVFWIHRTSEGIETVWQHTVMLHEDVHVEDTEGPTPGDCFGLGCEEEDDDSNTASQEVDSDEGGVMLLLALLALVGMVAMTLSIRKEHNDSAVAVKGGDEEA